MKHVRSFLLFAGCLLALLHGQPGRAQTGVVFGFGDNTSGQVGDNTVSANRPLPTPVFRANGIKAIACGYYHTLALDSSGMVWAWGDNSRGQLGTGYHKPVSSPQPIPVMSNIKAIAAGDLHSMALDGEGRVWIWGGNSHTQLGTDDWEDRYVPTLMPGPFNTHIKAIAAGSVHSLILSESGRLYGCGNNSDGELGISTPNWFCPTLAYISGGVTAMAGGSYHTLVLQANNWLYAMGRNWEGQLGDGTAQSRNRMVFCMKNVRAFAAGDFHSMAIAQDGKVYGWGSNGSGELGLGAIGRILAPTVVPNLRNAKAVAAGYGHTLILTANGKALASGSNGFGQLGDGTTTQRNTFVPVKNAAFIGAIAAHGLHSAILQPYTRAMASGLNNHGQLGIGNSTQQNTPVGMNNAAAVIAVASGSAYGMHSLLLRADGTVWACGANNYGQVGNGTLADSAAPVQVKGPNGVGNLTNIIAISAGDNHSLALAADGTVYAWGNNANGQLGVGSGANSPVPVQVPFQTNVFAIVAGGQHSLLLSEEGNLYACGANASGQLGLGDTDNHPYFEPVDGTFYIGMAAGKAHSMALYFTGEIFAWGSNGAGQLALGDTQDRHVPTVQPGAVAVSIAAGGDHSHCINGAGMLFGAGGNAFGQLGLGDTNPRPGWARNTAIVRAVSVTAGLTHTLLQDSFGTMLTCGNGSLGQLGNRATNNVQPFFSGILDTNGNSILGATGMAGGAYHSLYLLTPTIQVTGIAITPSIVKGGTTVTATVQLNGLAGPGGQRVAISFSSATQNGTPVVAASMPAYVDVAPNSRTATFTITTSPVTVKTITSVAVYLNRVLANNLTTLP